MKFHIIFYYCFVSIVIGEIVQNYETSKSNLPLEIIHAIKRDHNYHQIMLITKNENHKNSPLIKEFFKNLPILNFNSSILTGKLNHFNEMNSFKNLRATTLFLIIETVTNNNYQWTQETMNLIKKLSNAKIRPKCLILQLIEKNVEIQNDGQVLRKMWKSLFLDVTIMKVVKEKFTIHHLNPFVSKRGKMSENMFSAKFPLFPDKLQNLHDYRLEIGIFQRPPVIRVNRNSTKHPIEIFGPDAITIKIFSELMRFQLSFPASDEEFFGKYSCLLNKTTGFVKELLENRINFIGVTSISTVYSCPEETNEHVFLELDHYVAVIPIQESQSSGVILLFGHKFYTTILWTIVIMLLSWMVKNRLQFDKRIWNFTMTVQIIFGITVHQQLQELKERILFGLLLIINIFYSTNIFTALTEIYLIHSNNQVEINSLRELSESKFNLAVEVNFPIILESSGEENILRMWRRKEHTIIVGDLCLRSLIQVKDRCCFVKKSIADWFVNILLDENGDSLIKIVPEYLNTNVNAFLLEPGSPYVEKFQRIFQLLVQSGIRNQIEREFSLQNENQFYEEKENNDKVTSGFVIFGFLIFGFVVSIFTFIGELLMATFYKRCSSKVRL